MAIPGDPGNLGTDVALVTDLSPVWALASGRTNLAYAIARRFITPRGGLFYDPNYGLDLTAYLNAGLLPKDISALRGAIPAEAKKDEPIRSATVDLAFNAATRTLSIKLGLEDDDGPFDLVLLATDVTVSVLSVNGVTPAAATAAATTDAGATVGPPGPQGPQGPAGPSGGGGGSASEVLDDARTTASSTGAEEVVYQFDAVDFGALGATLTCELSAAVLSQSGTAVYRLRVGGTDGGADGTIVANMTATTAGYVQKNGSGSLSNPNGLQLVKVTAQSSGSGVDARIKGMTATFR